MLQTVFVCILFSGAAIAAPYFHHGYSKGRVTSHSITEASGIAASRKHSNIIYTHNDSGGTHRIFAVDATNGQRKATIYIDGAHSHDWEDIAVGDCTTGGGTCIYIGDTGGNAGGYEANIIYRVREPDGIYDQTIHVDSTLMYSWDQHDCETLMVAPKGEVYIVSKNRNGHGKLVHLPSYAWGQGKHIYVSGGTYLPISISSYGPVGGDICPSGHEILLKTYGHIYYWRITDGNYLEGMKQHPSDVSYNGERQGESVCWAADDSGYYTLSEGANQQLMFYQRG